VICTYAAPWGPSNKTTAVSEASLAYVVIDAPPTRTTTRATATQQRSRPEISAGRFEGEAKEMGFHDFIKIRKLHFLAGRSG
jgi:hypothetical protein